MEEPRSTIRSNAEVINRLNARIDETLRHRGQSEAKRREWEQACAAFHKAYPDLFFPGGSNGWGAFLARDPGMREAAIEFLEADPWFFRSGYLKQTIWTRLKQSLLSVEELQRLEAVALAYLAKQAYLEFWYMARYVRARGSAEFWSAIAQLAEHDQTDRGTKAGWLLLARSNYPVQNWLGREFLRARYESGYVPNIHFLRAANAA